MSGYKTIGYHVAIGVSTDRNGCVVLIFKEIMANNASAPQAANHKQSLVMDALAAVRSCVGFLSSKCYNVAC